MPVPFPPRVPAPTPWSLREAPLTPGEDLVAVGADLAPGTLLEAYARGLFPMVVGERELLGWWSPDPRGVLRPAEVVVRRSLRKTLARRTVTVDHCFAEVVRACGDPTREGGWITPEFVDAYVALHELGWAHSLEIWEDGDLAGGLYGVAIGGLFAGESMFHRRRDASKAALVALGRLLSADGDPRRIIDCQWATPHLRSLGCRSIPREDYLTLLDAALSAPAVDIAAVDPEGLLAPI